MNILIVSMQNLPAPGGVNTYITELTQGLIQKGHQVDLISQSDIPALEDDSKERIREYQKMLLEKLGHIPRYIVNLEVGKFAFKEIMKKLDIAKYEVVHSQDGLVSSAIGEVYPDVPLVGTVHGSFVEEYTLLGFITNELELNLISRLDYWAVEYPQLYILPSRHYEQHLPEIKDHKRIVPHGIDLNLFKKKATSRHSELKIVTTSSLFYYKGLDVLLEALVLLKNDQISFRLDIYGEGPELEALMKLSEEHQLPVKFMGYVEREELPTIYSTADIFVQPSRLESFGLTVTEAMACGCVPVCSNVGGLLDQVTHHQNGLIFQSEDHTELFQCLKYLAEHPEEAQRMSSNAARRVKEKFDINRSIEKTLNIYREAISMKERS